MKIIVNFSDFCNIHLKLDANFSSLAKINVFFRFYSFFRYIPLKNKYILAIIWEFDEQNWKNMPISVVNRENKRSKLMITITKMGKMLKSEKFMIILLISELKSENYKFF